MAFMIWHTRCLLFYSTHPTKVAYRNAKRCDYIGFPFYGLKAFKSFWYFYDSRYFPGLHRVITDRYLSISLSFHCTVDASESLFRTLDRIILKGFLMMRSA